MNAYTEELIIIPNGRDNQPEVQLIGSADSFQVIRSMNLSALSQFLDRLQKARDVLVKLTRERKSNPRTEN